MAPGDAGAPRAPRMHPTPPSPAAPSATAPPPTPPPPFPRRRARRGCARVATAAALVLLGLSAYHALNWPDARRLAQANPSTTSYIERYRDRERARGRAPSVAWTWVSYGRISPHLKRAVVAGEDMSFFSHHGFDLGEIRAALADAWRERRPPRGASTITQQLARNLWLSPSVDPVRKVREALLARDLERRLTKRRILEIYLNVVEFGPGVYGAEAAARRYYGKPAAELSEDEAARLAAALPSPARWHPGSKSRAAEKHARSIRRRMERALFLWREI